MKVLVADDDAVCRLLLHKTLTAWGYEVVAVSDGRAAWQVLQADDGPSLVILDWLMPGLDGGQLCRMIRERVCDCYTFVLMLTARRSHLDLLEGLQAGADEYLRKPFDPAELRARLNTGRRIVQLQNELIAARDALRRQATRDALTGVYNHAAILEILERELGRAHREGRPLGVAIGDLDHFKQVNDRHGHLAGDAVLRAVTDLLVTVMRPYDLIGRYGGEEFLVVLPGCDESSTFKVCERLRGRLAEQPVLHEGLPIPVTLSVGAAVSTKALTAGVVELIRAADSALYRAKALGRNRIELADGVCAAVSR